jgi:phage shock protein A
MEFLSLAGIDKLGAMAVFTIVAILVITDKLVWHTRLKKAEARADRWEAKALEALALGATAGVRAAEVAVGVVASIPDPQQRRDLSEADLKAGEATA